MEKTRISQFQHFYVLIHVRTSIQHRFAHFYLVWYKKIWLYLVLNRFLRDMHFNRLEPICATRVDRKFH